MSNTPHKPPEKPRIKILVYTDDSQINLTNDLSQFFGLGSMKDRLLAHQPTFATLDVQLFSRNSSTDNYADNTLDDILSGESFDEIWFFGLQSNTDNFSQLRRIHYGGAGILMTGGPADENPAYGSESALQTDRLPQQLELQPVNVNGDPDPHGQPHPIFFYKEGKFIDVFPGDAHGGSVAIPDGIRTQVVAISKDAPQSYEPVNKIETYNGDLAGAGRIVADSNSHHYMNLNLRGFPHPDQIGQFYANLAIWLAPKLKRQAMADLMFWELARHTLLLEEGEDAESMGATAESVLAMTASLCEVNELRQVSTPKEVADLYAAGKIELPSKEKLIGAVIQSYHDAMRADEPIDATTVINAGFKRAFKEHRAEIRKTLRTLSTGPLVGAGTGACALPSEEWTIQTESIKLDASPYPSLFRFCLSITEGNITGTVVDVDSGETLSEYVTGTHTALGGTRPGFSMSLGFDLGLRRVTIEGIKLLKSFQGTYEISAETTVNNLAAEAAAAAARFIIPAPLPPPAPDVVMAPGDGDMGSASGTQT